MKRERIGWGILGTADIARKNWLAIRNSGNGAVVAVASRTVDRAQSFIQQCQSAAPQPEMPRAFGSYEDLLQNDAVDAVYIPLPTALRKEWVLRAASAGKHVVCEKPCASNLQDLEMMLASCRRHGVQFMDGVMFMHSRRLEQMRATLDSSAGIGDIRRITSAFTFCGPPDFFATNIRAQPSLEPHGCLGDLGWYCLRFSLWAMRWQMPLEVTGRILVRSDLPGGSTAVISEFSGELRYEHGVSAGFFCSFLAQNQEWAQVSGSEGSLWVSDFVVPFAGEQIHFEVHHHEFVKSGCEFKMERRVERSSVAEPSQAAPLAQETNLFHAFAGQVCSGQLNQDWPDFALKTQKVMEACLTSAQQNSAVILPRAG